MKKILLVILITAAVFSSCDKKPAIVAGFTAVDSNLHTKIKFVNAYPFATPVFSGQTSAAVQLTYNGVQFSATPTAFGGAFPASPNYATVIREKTQAEMYVRLALGTPPAVVRDSALFSFTPNLDRAKYYTFFFCDSINRPNTIFTTVDDVKAPSRDYIRVRFVNLIPNPPAATPAIDVVSTLNGSVIFSGIPYKTATPFLDLPRNSTSSTVTDTYIIRWAGTTTVIGSVAVPLQNQVSITLFARGLVGATGTRAAGVSFYRNQ